MIYQDNYILVNTNFSSMCLQQPDEAQPRLNKRLWLFITTSYKLQC